MEMELEPRVKPLPYKIKAMSRESPSQKALHVLDTDLRTHWSTGTNTKEWILLELEEPCLLSHIRIYNKSVLEWEIAVGLRYKPETFTKVRPRCEAPRRDMMYSISYSPCRYVRISCLRGNPIAIFFIQLIGVTVNGLEPDFQPLVNYLLPQIISNKQDTHDMHLQLLQDVTNRLLPFASQLEADLSNFSEAAESNIQFFAMLAGPFHPILRVVNERENGKALGISADADTSKHNQPIALTVSSNFEVLSRRSRSPSPYASSGVSSVAFRPDLVFTLLRKAYREPHLGLVCQTASRALQKLSEPGTLLEASITSNDSASSSVSVEALKTETPSSHMHIADYSSLFGEDFKIPDDHWDASYLNVLDIGLVEEGTLHVLYACASQPFLCSKLAESNSNFWSALPFIQALLPALRPLISNLADPFDDNFSQWKQSIVQQALSQIVGTVSSSVYLPLLHACAGYLSSFSPTHVKAACILIDLCCGPLAPWVTTVIVKVDLSIELLEDLLGTIHGSHCSGNRARAALKYVILALSGHVDDILRKYKEVKHKLLFLIEMLEPFLDPATTALKNTIAFGDVSAVFVEKQEQSCALALNIIRTAVSRPAVLPPLESEWRRGSVAPSVLLSILGPHMPLPPEIDHCKCSASKTLEHETPINSSISSIHPQGSVIKPEVLETTGKVDVSEESNLLFAPPELKNVTLRSSINHFEGLSSEKSSQESSYSEVVSERKQTIEKNLNNHNQNTLKLGIDFGAEYFNLQSDYVHVMNYQDSELRASEFQRLAADLHSQQEVTLEGHEAAVDSLLLAAECYVNPFFMMSFKSCVPKSTGRSNIGSAKDISDSYQNICVLKQVPGKDIDLETVAYLERKRDRTVLQLLLQAADLDRQYHYAIKPNGERSEYDNDEVMEVVEISPEDEPLADPVTLVRRNQALLCHFLMKHLQREQHSMHEILMQTLLFLLYCATKLICPPEEVVDIILYSAEHLNRLLTSLYHQSKEAGFILDPEKGYVVQRRWVLLQRLVIASCGADEGFHFALNTSSGLLHKNLIPPSSWIIRIPKFSASPFPLVRFVGWMAISQCAKNYSDERLVLASELSQLSHLLSIFTDDLALLEDVVKQKNGELGREEVQRSKAFELSDKTNEGSFHVIYPDLYKFFPGMRKQFQNFGEIVLEAVALQLKSLPSYLVADALCWFKELCLWPFLADKDQLSGSVKLKGLAAKNVKAIILFILEALVSEHMEAMQPEIPRLMQILAALCGNSCFDVSFLDTVMCLLRPLISYALRKTSENEESFTNESLCVNFETLCFGELLKFVRNNSGEGPIEKDYQIPQVLFIFSTVFPDLSFSMRMEVLQSLFFLADFASNEPASSFHDYFCAFQNIMDSCQQIIVQSLREFGIDFSIQKSEIAEVNDESNNYSTSFPSEISGSILPEIPLENRDNVTCSSNEKNQGLSVKKTKEFAEGVKDLISKLMQTTDRCWKLHPQLAKKLTLTSVNCYMYCTCLSSICQSITSDTDDQCIQLPLTNSSNQISHHWEAALSGLAESAVTFEENHCWQVSSVILDYILGLPQVFSLERVVPTICFAIKNFCCHAPKLSWRLQTGKWLSKLLTRGVCNLQGHETSFIELFCSMLCHLEPEQRSIAVEQLGRLVSQATNEMMKLSFTTCKKLSGSDLVVSVPPSLISLLVANTWDIIASLASSETSMNLKTRSMVLLLEYIPFAERSQLQSFLAAADKILLGLTKHSYPMLDGPLTQLSLAVLGNICLLSTAEDMALIPESVWRNLESLGMPKAGGRLGETEAACHALCKLRIEGNDDAKEVLREVTSSSSATKHSDPDLMSTRETILQVLGNMTAVKSYFDLFSEKRDQESRELEEAEIELELLQAEHALQDVSGSSRREADHSPISVLLSAPRKDGRLQQIKDAIHSLEKSKLKEEVAARRQKKLIERSARQKYLEEAAVCEMQLLKELDRERTNLMEQEIERQRLLELERAKTRELQYNLDMERERQTQRELQRELDQVESGIRSSRREFSSSTSGRPRERYRERENGRSGHDGGVRSSSRGRDSGTLPSSGSGSPAAASISSAPTVVLTNSRAFSGHPPTILQARDRSEERIGGYEDSFDGSKDSGDAGSVGDPDLASAFDAMATGFGSASRHAPRPSKSRPMDRRERDGRREGKWERKQS